MLANDAKPNLNEIAQSADAAMNLPIEAVDPNDTRPTLSDIEHAKLRMATAAHRSLALLQAATPAQPLLAEDAFIDADQPIVFEADGEQIVLPLHDTLVIGRRSLAPSETGPRIDVKIARGKEHGLSRQHARVTRLGSLVYITDLGSSNGTFLNGQRLPASFSRLLHDGDELQLARLKVRVRFTASARKAA